MQKQVVVLLQRTGQQLARDFRSCYASICNPNSDQKPQIEILERINAGLIFCIYATYRPV
jgi:hypothetical protein